MKILPLFGALTVATSLFGQQVNSVWLDFNNVKATVSDEGGFFSNVAASVAGYEIPKNSGKSTIFSGSYWIGAEDQFGQLHVSANRYSWGGTQSSFHSGPIAESIAYGSINYSNQYQNAIWMVSKYEIDDHIANYQTTGYVVPTSIANWPGNGDVNLGVASQLAPYVDLNGNGQYEPSLGDYPEIRGDRAAYVIMNDESYQPDGNQLGIELHAMFYQYVTGDFWNDVTFLNLRAINRSNNNYINYRQALYLDFDIGNYTDDYMGSNPYADLLYGYNGDDIDEAANGQQGYGANPPCQGVVALSHNIANAGVFNSGQDANGGDTLFWLLMNNQWGDSSLWMNPVTNDWTNVIFPDNPNLPNGWNELTAGNSAGDRRGLITIGEPNLLSGASICSDYAFVYDRSGTTRFENVQNVFNKASAIKTFYNDFLTFPCHSPQFSGVKEQQQLIDIQLFPNPNNGKFTIQTDHQMKNARIEIRSLDGTLVYQSRISTTFTPIELNVADGMYVVHVFAEDNVIAKKVIIGTEK
jgi:hypothetical protein